MRIREGVKKRGGTDGICNRARFSLRNFASHFADLAVLLARSTQWTQRIRKEPQGKLYQRETTVREITRNYTKKNSCLFVQFVDPFCI